MKRIRSRLNTLWRQLGWRPLRVAARLTSACLVLSLFGSSTLTTIGWADGGTTVSIDPASQEILPEGTATTEVRVGGVTEALPLLGFQFQISFDQTVVEGVDITPGDFLDPGGMEFGERINNTLGTIDYGYVQFGGSPKSGSGVLAIITWHGKAVGTSPIHFISVELGAPGPVSIPADTQDGEIIVTSGAWPSGLFGDVDGDCDVDIVDIMQVACRWQTSCENRDPDDDPDTPNYDTLCDVNNDCVIDIEDIMQVAVHWGDTC